MVRRTYLINAGGRTHTLELNHSIWTNQRKVMLDGEIVERGGNFWQWGGSHEVAVGDDCAFIEIGPSGTSYAYRCSFCNQIVQSEEDKKAGKDFSKFEKRKIAVGQFWHLFSHVNGLQKLPTAPDSTIDRQWYAGYMRGRFVLVRPERLRVGEGHIEVLQVTVKCRKNGNLTELKRELKAALNAEGIKTSNETLNVDVSDVSVSLTYLPEKHPVEETAKDIQKIVCVVTRHTSPLPSHVCENEFCNRESVQHTQLVLINSAVLFLCDACVNDLPAQYAKMKQAYAKRDAKLLRGTTFAICGAIAAAIIWAIITIGLFLWRDNADLVSLSLLWNCVIVYATFKAYFKGAEGAQRVSLLGASVAWIASMVGVVVSFYLFSLFLAMYHANFQLQFDVFVSAWVLFAEDLFNVRYFIIPVLFSASPMMTVVGQFLQIKQALDNPAFEVIPDSAWLRAV